MYVASDGNPYEWTGFRSEENLAHTLGKSSKVIQPWHDQVDDVGAYFRFEESFSGQRWRWRHMAAWPIVEKRIVGILWPKTLRIITSQRIWQWAIGPIQSTTICLTYVKAFELDQDVWWDGIDRKEMSPGSYATVLQTGANQWCATLTWWEISWSNTTVDAMGRWSSYCLSNNTFATVTVCDGVTKRIRWDGSKGG
jgi:hypothetical protein